MKNKIILLALITTPSFLFGGHASGTNPFASPTASSRSCGCQASQSTGQDISMLISTNSKQQDSISKLQADLDKTRTKYFRLGVFGVCTGFVAGAWVAVRVLARNPVWLEKLK